MGFRHAGKEGLEPLAAAKHLQPVPPPVILGLFCTSDGFVALCPLWSEAVLPLPNPVEPIVEVSCSSGTTEFFALSPMKVPVNQRAVTV